MADSLFRKYPSDDLAIDFFIDSPGGVGYEDFISDVESIFIVDRRGVFANLIAEEFFEAPTGGAVTLGVRNSLNKDYVNIRNLIFQFLISNRNTLHKDYANIKNLILEFLISNRNALNKHYANNLINLIIAAIEKNLFVLNILNRLYSLPVSMFINDPSVRFDTSGECLTRTASVPAESLLTVIMWIYIVVDRNAASSIFTLNDGVASGCGFGLTTDGTTLEIQVAVGGTIYNATGSNLSLGTWYPVAYVRNNDNHQLRLGINADLDASLTRALSQTETNFLVSHNAASYLFNGRVRVLKIYSAELSQSEISREMKQSRPARVTDLWGCWPLKGYNDLNDISGNGRHLTGVGTLSSEDGPPIPDIWLQTYGNYSQVYSDLIDLLNDLILISSSSLNKLYAKNFIDLLVDLILNENSSLNKLYSGYPINLFKELNVNVKNVLNRLYSIKVLETIDVLVGNKNALNRLYSIKVLELIHIITILKNSLNRNYVNINIISLAKLLLQKNSLNKHYANIDILKLEKLLVDKNTLHKNYVNIDVLKLEIGIDLINALNKNCANKFNLVVTGLAGFLTVISSMHSDFVNRIDVSLHQITSIFSSVNSLLSKEILTIISKNLIIKSLVHNNLSEILSWLIDNILTVLSVTNDVLNNILNNRLDINVFVKNSLDQLTSSKISINEFEALVLVILNSVASIYAKKQILTVIEIAALYNFIAKNIVYNFINEKFAFNSIAKNFAFSYAANDHLVNFYSAKKSSFNYIAKEMEDYYNV